MVEEKNWYESKTIWGALVAVAASVAGGFGLSIDSAAQGDLADAIIRMVGALGAVIAVYGRLGATRVIS